MEQTYYLEANYETFNEINSAIPAGTYTFTEIGAAAYANGSKDAAFFVTLNPGVYTVHLSGVGGLTGVVIC
jgi:hypothetical protein